MSQLTYAGASLPDFLADTTAVGKLYAGALIGLCTNPAPLVPTSQLADVVEPTYAGYARSAAAVWGVPFVDRSGRATCFSDVKTFVPTADTVTSTITGVTLISSDGTKLLASYMLDTPIPMGTTQDQVLVAFPLLAGQPSDGLPDIIP